MNKVWKYTVKLDDYIEVLLPENAIILRVGTQDDGASGMIQIWVLAHVRNLDKLRRFRIAGTGHEIRESPYYLNYINTFTMMNKALWFHAFEILEEK